MTHDRSPILARTGFRRAALAAFLWSGMGSAAFAQYATDFSTGAGWGFSSNPASSAARWNIDATPGTVPGGAVRGNNSLNYNNGTDFNVPGSNHDGLATSQVIPIGSLPSPTLTFWCNFQTEPGSENASPGVSADERWIAYVPGGSASPIYEILGVTGHGPMVGPCSSMGTWHPHSVKLPAGWTQVQIQFGFYAHVPSSRRYAGWFIDDFTISSGVVLSSGPTSPREGDNGDNWFNDACGGSVAPPTSARPWGAAAGAALIFAVRRRRPR